MTSSTCIVIPARQHSTRLPNKLLLSETGRPLLAHSVERAKAAAQILCAEVHVACDTEELAAAAKGAGARVVMITEYCESGTERIWRALPSLSDADIVVNLQADEPEMPVEWIVSTVRDLSEDQRTDVATFAVSIESDERIVESPNVVKVVLDHAGNALYFSRAPIPYAREGGERPVPRALRHVGLYAYRRRFLERYAELPRSSLEQCECLEQLRFLQAGARIRVVVERGLHAEIRGIDTAADYREFVERYRENCQQ